MRPPLYRAATDGVCPLLRQCDVPTRLRASRTRCLSPPLSLSSPTGPASFPLVRKKAVNQLQSLTDSATDDDRRCVCTVVPRSPPSRRRVSSLLFVQTICAVCSVCRVLSPPSRTICSRVPLQVPTQNTKSQHHRPSPPPLHPNISLLTNTHSASLLYSEELGTEENNLSTPVAASVTHCSTVLLEEEELFGGYSIVEGEQISSLWCFNFSFVSEEFKCAGRMLLSDL